MNAVSVILRASQSIQVELEKCSLKKLEQIFEQLTDEDINKTMITQTNWTSCKDSINFFK